MGSSFPDQHKKKRFLEEKRQLEHKATGLEKESNGMIFNKRSEFRKEFLALEECNEQYDKNKMTEFMKLKQQLMKIKTNVEKLQRSLKDVKTSPAFVEKLKEIMEDIENSILNFKKDQREKFEELLREEKVITQDLTASEKKFDSWARLPAAVVESTKALKKAENRSSSLPPAIAAFERFLTQTGGHQGGWEDYDHQEYLRLKQHNKNKKKDAFIQSALSNIPGKSFDDIRQHDDWYSEYLVLLEKKRKAIVQWKEHKKTEKIDKLSQVDDSEKSVEKEKMKAERMEKERQERLSKLDEWKELRELKKEREAEEEARVELKALKTQEKEQRRRREIKSQVQEYARHREEEKEIMRMAVERRQELEKEEKKLNATDIARLQQRNEKIANDRKLKIQSKEMEKAEKEKRLDKLRRQVEVHVERDPSRLFMLTEGLKERKKSVSNTGSRGPVIHLPHRAVPSWRQGMM